MQHYFLLFNYSFKDLVNDDVYIICGSSPTEGAQEA